ncbi:hypothetical protein FC34_GL001800 [Lacticaseibacillus brantae DSM 23927]|uniref:CAAX prenyl protease 2/Lysostaphin resistance protein A-like domain-containing protein n=1 Tax=Lacticaseibacillus brantae DSM 23927 TaxID=1423727 RepID=A0A0R2AVA1_9LACO|nr:hypothetical protein FC34_GL001800 [Lacticaseibacillus brantae DSM 23927]
MTLLMFGVYSLFAQTLVFLPGMVAAKNTDTTVPTAIVFIIVFGGLIYLLYSIAANWRRHDGELSPTNLTTNRVRLFLLMIVALIAIQFIGGLMTSTGITQEATNQKALLELSKQFPVALALIAVVGAPPVEEFIFRALLMNSFPDTSRTWRIVRVAVSAIVFGLVHAPTEPLNFLIYAGMGLVFAYTFERTGDIRYSIGLHFLNNFFALFI